MIIVTGLSGAGKSIALNALEDAGYDCLDNFPPSLLLALLEEYDSARLAVAIDSRNPKALLQLPQMLQDLRTRTEVELIFLTAETTVITRRFAQTRRPHPLHIQSPHTNATPKALWETIEDERQMLSPLAELATLCLDSSPFSVYDLKDRIRDFVNTERKALCMTIQSFGFKHGVPQNTDYVFDVRFLPNPYWQADLRECSGLEEKIVDFLGGFPECVEFANDSAAFLERWLPYFVADQNRAYVTISVGCTGGRHRSVYIAEQLKALLSKRFEGVQVYHRDIERGG